MTPEPRSVVITSSAPYVKVAGGWTGMRPVGLRRDYTATVDGRTFTNTSKDEIKRRIRQHVYRMTGSDRVRFTIVDGAGRSC